MKKRVERKKKEVTGPKPHTKEYYQDGLHIITAILFDYDGYNPRSAKQMTALIEDVKEIIKNLMKGKDLYSSK